MDPCTSHPAQSEAARRNPPGTQYAYHDPEGPAKPSTTVVHALAAAMDRDVSDVGFTLYDSIAPEALDALFANTSDADPPGHVAFGVPGYGVTVYSDGQIVITPMDRPAQ